MLTQDELNTVNYKSTTNIKNVVKGVLFQTKVTSNYFRLKLHSKDRD